MDNEFLTFQKFKEKDSAIALTDLLLEENIEYLLVDESASFDLTMTNSYFGKEFRIKIRKEDFEKVEMIIQQQSISELEDIPEDYYLFEFADEELLDVIIKRDEWNQFDFLLAQKLLKERGKEITPELVNLLKKQRIEDLSKPEESQKTWIIAGYVFAVLGGVLGIFIGWHLSTHKKTLPNGDRLFAYSEHDRKQGKNLFLIGIISSIFWVTIKIINTI